MVVLTSGYTNPDQAEKLIGDFHLFYNRQEQG